MASYEKDVVVQLLVEGFKVYQLRYSNVKGLFIINNYELDFEYEPTLEFDCTDKGNDDNSDLEAESGENTDTEIEVGIPLIEISEEEIWQKYQEDLKNGY